MMMVVVLAQIMENNVTMVDVMMMMVEKTMVKNVKMMMMMMMMVEKTMLAIPICCQCIAMSRSTEQLLALSLGKL